MKKTAPKQAVIHSVRVAGSHQFGWKWRSVDGSRASTDAYVYFFDCIQSARKAGYECRYGNSEGELPSPHAGSEPGSTANA